MKFGLELRTRGFNFFFYNSLALVKRHNQIESSAEFVRASNNLEMYPFPNVHELEQEIFVQIITK